MSKQEKRVSMSRGNFQQTLQNKYVPSSYPEINKSNQQLKIRIKKKNNIPSSIQNLTELHSTQNEISSQFSSKQLITTLENFKLQIDQIWESNKKINQLVQQKSKLSNKVNALRIKQLIISSCNLVFCEFMNDFRREETQQSYGYSNKKSKEQIIEEVLIKRIQRLCEKQLANEKYLLKEHTISNMLDERIKKLQKLKTQ